MRKLIARAFSLMTGFSPMPLKLASVVVCGKSLCYVRCRA
jgi:hypothetical protein